MFDVQAEIVSIRKDLADAIHRIQELVPMVQPPIVQEIILAQRHAEDSRMRTGVALALLKGEDPFRDREPEIAKEA